MIEITPHLSVKNGKKAIEHYKKLFGAKLIDHMPFSKEIGNEFGFPKDFNYKNSTMHSVLEINGVRIYVADDVSGADKKAPGAVEIVVSIDSKAELDKIYEKAKNLGCTIVMELQKTFWGAFYARFIDLEGIGWQLNHQEAE